MPVRMPEAEEFRVFGVLFTLASMGGLFRALSKKVRVFDALVSAGVSGLAGTVIGCACVHLWGTDNWYLTCAIVGASSWIPGAVLLDAASKLVWDAARSRLPGLPDQPPPATLAPVTAVSVIIDTAAGRLPAPPA